MEIEHKNTSKKLPVWAKLVAQLVICLTLAWISGRIIILNYWRHWRRVQVVVYQATPLPLPETGEIVIEAPTVPEEPVATFSANFLGDLIKAILEATTSAQASAEAELLMSDFDPN